MTSEVRVLHVGASAGVRADWRRVVDDADDAIVVSFAGTPEDAHATLADGDADCIVTDLGGDEPLEPVRVLDEADVPVVVYTARGDEHLASRAVSAGAARYLVADRDGVDRLVEAVLAVVDAHRERVATAESERRFRQIAGHIDAAVWMTDADIDEMLYLSPRYADVFGHPVDMLLEDAWADLEFIHADDRDRAVAAFERWADGEFGEVEYRILHQDGSVHWIHERAFPIRDTDGEVARIAGIAEDVTEDHERRRELRRQNERLETFSSVVAHDLRNPLNTALGYLDLAQTDPPSTWFDPLAESLDRIARIVDDLLTMARLGDEVPDVDSVSVGGVAERAWGTVDTADATLAVDGRIPPVLASESLVRTVLENLFRNAVTHGGEAVTVTVGPIDGGSSESGDETLGFFVEDDGPGVPAAAREQVFERGYSTSEGGTGFGLAIVARIADAHDWEVAVVDAGAAASEAGESADADDRPTGGARFEFTGLTPG